MFHRKSDRDRAAVPRTPCVPMEVGKLGFTGVCSAVRPGAPVYALPVGKYKGRDATSYSGTDYPCHLSSNLGPNITTADLYARMLRSH